MPYKFLPCQLKKNMCIVYLFYICVEFLLLRNFQLKHRFKNEKSQKWLKIRRKQQNGSLQTGVYRLYGSVSVLM